MSKLSYPRRRLHPSRLASCAQRTSSKDAVFVADVTEFYSISVSGSHEYPIFHEDQCMVCLPSFTIKKIAIHVGQYTNLMDLSWDYEI